MSENTATVEPETTEENTQVEAQENEVVETGEVEAETTTATKSKSKSKSKSKTR